MEAGTCPGGRLSLPPPLRPTRLRVNEVCAHRWWEVPSCLPATSAASLELQFSNAENNEGGLPWPFPPPGCGGGV